MLSGGEEQPGDEHGGDAGRAGACHGGPKCRPNHCATGNYTVDHSGNLVIIGPDGEQHGFIRAPLNNAKLEAQLPGVIKPQA